MTKAKSNPTTNRKRWTLYAVSVAVVSWVGLWGVIRLPVTSTTKMAFFTLLFTAITSTVMPPVSYLNARFGKRRDSRTHQVRFVRQCIWIGLFVVVAAWLQTRRVLSVMLALILMAVFVLTETFLITRESPPEEL